MKNALQQYRELNDLTYEALAREVGLSRALVWKHCHAKVLPGESVLVYHARLGLPLEDLRPDIYGSQRPAPADQEEAQHVD